MARKERMIPKAELALRERLYRIFADLYVHLVPIIRRTPRPLESLQMGVRGVELFAANRLGRVLSTNEYAADVALKQRMRERLHRYLAQRIRDVGERKAFYEFLKTDFSLALSNRIRDYGYCSFKDLVTKVGSDLQPKLGYKRFQRAQIMDIEIVLGLYDLHLGMTEQDYQQWRDLP